MSLPIYRITIQEDVNGKQEVDFIALTDNPAIMSNFLKFDKRQRFEVTDEAERIITGLALIADLPIYRYDDMGEYYVVFTRDEIKKIVQKFFRKQYQSNLNENHNPNKVIDGIYIFESYIVDRAKGKEPMKQFADVADGSWIISAKIENDKTWKEVEDGKFTGFSVEGLFGMEKLPGLVTEEEKFESALIKQLEKLLQEFN